MVHFGRFMWKDVALLSFWLLAFIATHLPKIPQSMGRVSDKTLHSVSFLILSGLLSWVLHGRITGLVRHAAIVLLIIAVYGAVDELLQIPVGRHCDFQDWIADMQGGIVGLTLFHLTHRIGMIFSKRDASTHSVTVDEP